MENLRIDRKKHVFYIPEVFFDAETGICNIKGDSYSEDTVKFYTPIINWLLTYIEEVNGPVTFNFSLNYFDTRSSKSFIDLLLILKDYKKKGGEVTINWHIDDDDDLAEEVEDYAAKVEIEINIFHTQGDDD